MSTYLTTAFVTQGTLLDHTRIGHASITRLVSDASTVSVIGGVADGSTAKAPAGTFTYDYWEPTELPAAWQIGDGLKADEEHINYLGIAAHTLGTTGTTVRWQTKVGVAAWTTRHEFTPTDDTPIMVLDVLDTNSDPDDGIRHRISLPSQSGSEMPKVGVVYMGQMLTMERGLYGGHTPSTLTPVATSLPIRSDAGQFIGNSIIRKGMKGSWSWSNLTASWYRANFVPFIEDFASFPAFISWRPSSYPDEVGYIWRGDRALPSGTNSGRAGLMDVTLTAEGHGGDMGFPGVSTCG